MLLHLIPSLNYFLTSICFLSTATAIIALLWKKKHGPQARTPYIFYILTGIYMLALVVITIITIVAQ